MIDYRIHWQEEEKLITYVVAIRVNYFIPECIVLYTGVVIPKCVSARIKDSAFSSATMWLWKVLWRASALLVVTGTLDINFFTQNRKYVPTSQVSNFADHIELVRRI